MDNVLQNCMYSQTPYIDNMIQKQLTVFPSYTLHYNLIKNLDKPTTPYDERDQLSRGAQRLDSTDVIPLYRKFRRKDKRDETGPEERHLPQLRHLLPPVSNLQGSRFFMEPKIFICHPGYTARVDGSKGIDHRTDDGNAAQDGMVGKQHLHKRPEPMIKVDFCEEKSGPAARRVSHPVHPGVHEPDPVEDHGSAEREMDGFADSASAVTGECGRLQPLNAIKTPSAAATDAEEEEEPGFDGVELGWGTRKGDVEECDEGRELEA